jgi:hypothetical protein
MRISLKNSRLGILNSTTRIPFRYGRACLTKCPQATLAVTIEAGGTLQRGYSADCLPPGWFDKTPGKSFAQQIDDMLAAIAQAEGAFAEELRSEAEFFPAWRAVHRGAADWQWTPLLRSFGISMVERAVMDAMCRAANLSFFRAVKADLFGIVPSEVHGEVFRGVSVSACTAPKPIELVFVRHTVGLADPLTAADIPEGERLNDGRPQALEEYVERTGLRYFKVKVSNRLDHDISRLKQIAALVERKRGVDYGLTLDGNELYRSAGEFMGLVDEIHNTPELSTLWANTFCIEQPLERGIALEPEHAGGLRELGKQKPVIIDESDGALDSYARAIEVGYRGVSSKNCKGPIKSLLNACLTCLHNDRAKANDYLMTGEDLCSVGIIPVQADLCLTATLGLTNVERNGHHYHPGLSYLPRKQQLAALERHPDFYAERHGIIAPNLVDGRFQTGSLQCVGFGFAVEPDMDGMQPAGEWEFDSLGLDE